MTFVLCRWVSCIAPNVLQFTTSNNMPVDSTWNQIVLVALNRLHLKRAFKNSYGKHVARKESYRGKSFSEVMVCTCTCTARQYFCPGVYAALERAADCSLPTFCTSEGLLLLQLAGFTSL